jgi:hypothetical protein
MKVIDILKQLKLHNEDQDQGQVSSTWLLRWKSTIWGPYSLETILNFLKEFTHYEPHESHMVEDLQKIEAFWLEKDEDWQNLFSFSQFQEYLPLLEVNHLIDQSQKMRPEQDEAVQDNQSKVIKINWDQLPTPNREKSDQTLEVLSNLAELFPGKWVEEASRFRQSLKKNQGINKTSTNELKKNFASKNDYNNKIPEPLSFSLNYKKLIPGVVFFLFLFIVLGVMNSFNHYYSHPEIVWDQTPVKRQNRMPASINETLSKKSDSKRDNIKIDNTDKSLALNQENIKERSSKHKSSQNHNIQGQKSPKVLKNSLSYKERKNQHASNNSSSYGNDQRENRNYQSDDKSYEDSSIASHDDRNDDYQNESDPYENVSDQESMRLSHEVEQNHYGDGHEDYQGDQNYEYTPDEIARDVASQLDSNEMTAQEYQNLEKDIRKNVDDYYENEILDQYPEENY